MQTLIDNMHRQSYDFQSELKIKADGDALDRLLVMDGSYVPGEGYALHADVKLPGFETESDILSLNEQLYFKPPASDRWEATTEQDLRMLGIVYKDSPADLFQGMKETVLSVEPAGEQDLYHVILDRDAYAKGVRDKDMFLPQVNMSEREAPVQLLQNPVVDVRVDWEEQVIRALSLHYVLGAPGESDAEPQQAMDVTFEMTMNDFNGGQSLPALP